MGKQGLRITSVQGRANHFRALKVINATLFCMDVNAVVYRVFSTPDCDASDMHYRSIILHLESLHWASDNILMQIMHVLCVV